MFTVACPRIAVTVATGEGWTTLPIAQSIMYHLFVKASNADTVFDVEIQNSIGDVIYSRTDNDGELNEEIRMPFAQRATLYIKNATIDGTFVVIPAVQDG